MVSMLLTPVENCTVTPGWIVNVAVGPIVTPLEQMTNGLLITAQTVVVVSVLQTEVLLVAACVAGGTEWIRANDRTIEDTPTSTALTSKRFTSPPLEIK